jgi:hypothetical protein
MEVNPFQGNPKSRASSYYSKSTKVKIHQEKLLKIGFITRSKATVLRGVRKNSKKPGSILFEDNVLLLIVQNLTTRETFKIMQLNKQVYFLLRYGPQFEGQWMLKSFRSLLSKTGF